MVPYIKKGTQPTNILFLHGFLGSKWDWLPIIESLSDSFTCYALDLPYHGDFKSDRSYSIPSTARAVIDFLRDNDIHRPWFVGYSMGGRVGWELATHYRDFFKGFIIEAAHPGLSDPFDKKIRLEWELSIQEKINTLSPLDFLKEWYANPLFSTINRHPKYDLFIHTRLSSYRQADYAKAVVDLGSGHMASYWPSIPALAPVHFISGELDTKYTTMGEDLHFLNPLVKHYVLPGASHTTHFDYPSLFTETLRTIIN